jgi:L-amino acid N-acyltransferase YncA
MKLRLARVDDAAALREIYRPSVEGSVVSFEMEVPSVEEFAARIERVHARWTWLLAEVDGEIAGYAYGGAHREREAYDLSVETSAYIGRQFQRRGVARALYERLFVELEQLGYRNAYAGIALPNESSVGFHGSLGFAEVGVFPRVGRKLGRWVDVAWLHRVIGDQE